MMELLSGTQGKRYSFFLFILLIISACLGWGGIANAIVFVDGAESGGDGTSWEQAFTTIEEAIASSGPNQEFWVATGIYTPGQALVPEAGSAFFGGFSGAEVYRSSRNISRNQTIIEGRNSIKHCFKVLTANVRIDGFKLQNGLANATSVEHGANYDQYGGGVYIGRLTENTVIANCTIVNCSSITMGGGIFVDRVPATITNCIFQGNSSVLGGALAGWESSPDISFCHFTRNHADQGDVNNQGKRGGAIWLNDGIPTISSCHFTSNSAYQGGAIELNNTQGAIIACSNFSANIAYAVDTDNVLLRKGTGGAIALLWDEANYAKPSVDIENCLFQNNIGEFAGGAVYSYYFPVALKVSQFIGNMAEEGGGIFYDYKLDTFDSIERCFFASNIASNLERGIGMGGAVRSHARSLYIDNSIFVNNQAYNGVGTDFKSGGGAIAFHGGDGSHFDPFFIPVISNSTFYNNSTDGWGGAINSAYVRITNLINCILWDNDAGQSYWNPDVGGHQASKDVALNGYGAVDLKYSDVETLFWNHGRSVTSPVDNITGSIDLHPLFVDPDGDDDILGTLDDNFQLDSVSPCIDRANGSMAGGCDYAFFHREDHPTVPNMGVWNPNYADMGALERVDDGGTLSCSFTVCDSFPSIMPPSVGGQPPTGNVVMAPVTLLLGL